MKKNNLITFGLILSLCLFVVFLRINFLSLPALDKIARSEVYGEVWEKVKAGVDKEYVNVPQKRKDSLAQRFYGDYLKQGKYLLKEDISQKTKEKKDFYRNDKGHMYVSGVDSYYWLRLIDNLIHKGHIGDSVKDGQDYDDLVGMPIEKSLSRSMHLILGSLLYKFFAIFNPGIDYDIGLYFIPLLLSILLVILTFLVTKMLCRSNLAAFFSTVAINLSPLLLQRTMFEWLDTDIYNVLFPLLIFGAFLFVFKSGNITRKSFGLAVFSLSCAFYASVWQGWWHIFDLLILCGVVFILGDYSETKDKALFKRNMFWVSLLFILGLASVGIVNGKESSLGFILGPHSIISALKDVPYDNWPNVFLTVAELKKISPYELAMEAGGVVVFFLAILGSVYLVFSNKILRDTKSGIGYFCLFIWLGTLYYVSLNALRLALLLIVPLGLMFGIAIDALARKIFNFSRRFSKKTHFAIVGILAFIIYHLFSFYAIRAFDVSYLRAPLMNDAWYKSMEFIRDDSGEDAIINSWWDYGHWFKAVAKRKVLFDGKTQNSPVAYWVARALIADNEDEAVGILRMLNISKNEAFDILESYGLSHVSIIGILNDVARLKESDARIYLGKVLDKNKVDELIPLLYAKEMPPVYFIASFDIAAKIRAISHIGN
ncbi:MAG: STT3 domain-containing protein, partial [Candidatus Omnitrophica bacterium]|nr:STT3 domain-containing protein [Candidatus Omnitrophota bacterium]